jgi:hypothetical protein
MVAGERPVDVHRVALHALLVARLALRAERGRGIVERAMKKAGAAHVCCSGAYSSARSPKVEATAA